MSVSYKVLIVDDKETVRDFLAAIFLRFNHHCESANDGTEALEKVAHGSFDAVVTDVAMPGMDGITLTKELIKVYPDLPVMVMTGYVEEHYEESAIAAGAREFIKKPFSAQELILRFDKMMHDQRRQEALLAHSLTDDLTGLYNRRRFFVLAEQSIKVAVREKKRLLLLFIDMDGLKDINDRYGHAEGDRALKDLADVLKKTLRKSDIVGRFGGDEFVVLLGPADEKSKGMLSRLHGNLDEHNAEGSRHYQLSISVGMALFDPEHPVTFNELLTKADLLMYAQKRKGDNRVLSKGAVSPCY